MKDSVLDIVKLIRKAKTNEDGKKVLLNNFMNLLEDEEIQSILNNRVEGPIDEYYLSKSNDNLFLKGLKYDQDSSCFVIPEVKSKKLVKKK